MEEQDKKDKRIFFTTGDLEYNAARFNGDASPALTEAHERVIRRYYIRPLNVYCSTKKDVLEALVKAGDKNCSVYSLKNIEDKDKVNLLKTSDILYYYDDRVLYDKNHVQVVDYNLNIKKEEDRRKVTDVDSVPEETLKKEYKDRVTPYTVDEGFNYFVEDFGEPEDEKVCCICGDTFEGRGNNPEPFMPAYDKYGDREYACDACNAHFVIPARLRGDREENDRDTRKD